MTMSRTFFTSDLCLLVVIVNHDPLHCRICFLDVEPHGHAHVGDALLVPLSHPLVYLEAPSLVDLDDGLLRVADDETTPLGDLTRHPRLELVHCNKLELAIFMPR